MSYITSDVEYVVYYIYVGLIVFPPPFFLTAGSKMKEKKAGQSECVMCKICSSINRSYN